MVDTTRATRANRVMSAWRLGASGLAISLMLAGPAIAQTTTGEQSSATDDQEVEEGDVVVTGFREALQSAQQLKRNSDVIQDSVTAEDIGALPDRSVTETLQRIPGISINRFAAGVDPDHFSVEGSGVVVRGLTYVRSEFNGREAFTANNGRALGFADVPSELLGGVDVFKSPSADRVEGGIAGVVNLRTRLPFDKKELIIAGSIEQNYGDFVNKSSPVVSGLISNVWQTGIGEIGLLGSLSYSQLFSRADRLQVSSFRARQAFSDGTREDVVQFPGSTPSRGVIFPRGAVIGTQDFNRERYGYSAAAQWRSNDGRAEAAFQFLRSDARQAWTEHVIEIATDNVASNGDSRAVAGTTLEFDDSGLFESGLITGPTGWRADQNTGAARTPILGLQSNNIRRDHLSKQVTSDYAFNFRYRATDNLRLTFDYQHVDSSSDVLDNGLWASTYQDAFIRLNGADVPEVRFVPPQNCENPVNGQCQGVPGTAEYPAYYTGGNQSYLSPANSFYRSAMDHIERSTGNSDAFRIDADLAFPDDSFLRSVKVGARYADRDQTARFSTYNWGRLSEQWGNDGPVWMDDPVDGVPGGSGGTPLTQFEPFLYSNFFRGGAVNPVGSQGRLFYSGNTARNYQDYIAFANAVNREWEPTITTADGRVINGGWRSLADRPNALAGQPFTAGEINNQRERNKAAYIVANFGTDFSGGQRLSGNVGVRYTTTNRSSEGFIEFPFATNLPDDATCLASINNAIAEGTSINTLCALTPAQLGQIGSYLNGAIVPNNFDIDYEYWLPSFNVKFELGNGLQFRAAYSKGVTPPDLGLVRNYFPVGVTAVPNVDASGNNIPIVVTPVAPGTGAFGSDGVVAPGQVRIQGSFNAGNPELLPIIGDSFDVTAEWYFSNVGQVTGSLFYKRLKNVLTNNTVRRTFTNNGETFEAVVTTPVNSTETGEIRGFEVTYQQTFDFLPGFMRGLGLQANYTYIESSGVSQSTLSATDPDVAAGLQPTISGENFPLQGLSKHQFNITPFLDSGPISLRASYNWRSRYLLTLRDVITPFDPIFQRAYGQLDASVTFNISDQLKLGAQGVNLLNSQTVTEAAILDQNDEVRMVPRGWYVNDRRFTLFARFNF